MTPTALPDLPGLGSAVEALGPAGRLVLACYLVMAVAVAVDLAGAPPGRRPMDRARTRSLAVTAAGALVLGLPTAAALAGIWAVLGRLAPGPLVATWRAHPMLAALACFVVVDAVAYLYHRVGHRTRVGWAAHGVHHGGETFDMSLVLRQPWFPVHGLAVLPLTAVVGFSLELATACSAVSLTYQALQHTSRSWGLGRCEAVLMSGRAHRRHHTVGGGGTNLGAVLTVWDRAFGTWCGDDVEPGATYGWGRPEPTHPIAIQLDGWRAALGRGRRPAPPTPPARTGASPTTHADLRGAPGVRRATG